MFFSFDSKRAKTLKALEKNSSTAFMLKDVVADEKLAAAIAAAAGLNGIKDKGANLARLGAITELNAAGLGIEDLTGLELLNNLRTADFSSNRLTKLPDFTQNAPGLYGARDKLIYLNLAGNPFLAPERLFSLESTENRRKFFNAFDAAAFRFGLGEARDKVFGQTTPDPQLIRLAMQRFLPKTAGEDREARLDRLLLKYRAGKHVFHNKHIWDDLRIIDGKPVFPQDKLIPALRDEEGARIASENIEQMLPEEDLYLIRSILKKDDGQALPADPNQLAAYYTENPQALSDDYLPAGDGWQEKEDYAALRSSELTSREEATLSAIADTGVRQQYARYLRFRDILSDYAKDRPERAKDAQKMIRRAQDFTTEFLGQYLALQDNSMLSEEQRSSLLEAGASFEKYVNSFEDQARNFFDKDVFDLEVQMHYIDMLAEADKKMGA